MAWGVKEGQGQNNVVIYMGFVLIYSKGLGSKSCKDWQVVEGTIYIIEGQC
jgi:hypothetical protein